MQRHQVQGLWRCADVEGPFSQALTQACRLLQALACTQSVQVRSLEPPLGTPQDPNILAWDCKAAAKVWLIFPVPPKTISEKKNRPIVCFFSLAAICKSCLPLIGEWLEGERHFYNFMFSSESWQLEFRRFSLQDSDPRVHATPPPIHICSSSCYTVPRKKLSPCPAFPKSPSCGFKGGLNKQDVPVSPLCMC